MTTGRPFWNYVLTLTCCAALAQGCASQKDEKQDELISTLRIHCEVPDAQTEFSIRVPVGREAPVQLTVDKEPLLTEVDVTEARLVDVVGGFDLQIRFDHHGSLLLEQYTTSNPGRRLAIYSQFGKTAADRRWIAAPEVSRRITSGVLTFTPDASRAETERLALGLNNVARKIKERTKW